MDRIVVEWSIDGGFECGAYLNTVCVEYESIEAFYCELEEATRKYSEEYKAAQAAWKKWNDEEFRPLVKAPRIPARKAEDALAAQKKFEDVRSRQPKMPESDFVLAGYKWHLHDFISNPRTDAIGLDLPEIKKLDEWFEEKKNENPFVG